MYFSLNWSTFFPLRRETVVKEKAGKLLDNTQIHRLKAKKSDKLIFIVCILVISAVIAFAGYAKLKLTSKQKAIELLADFKLLSDGERHFNSKGTDISAVPYADSFPEEDTTTLDSLIPLSYIWYVSPKISSSVYSSIICIEVKCMRKTSVISFRSSTRLKIKDFAIKAVDKRETPDIDLLGFSYNENGSAVLFRLSTELIPGHLYSLYIGFDGPLLATESDGMLLKKYVDGNSIERQMVYAAFQPGSASHLFPNLANSMKATFQIILLHSRKFSAISNTPVEKIVNVKHGKIETHFNKLSSMSHALSFIISEYTYEIVPSTDFQVRLYIPEGRSGDASTAKKMIQSFLHYYRTIFGAQVKIPKLDLVTMQHFGRYMSPGLVILPEHLFLSGKHPKTLEQIETSVKLLAKRLMEQLLGCLATMKNWNEMWFRDSMSLYIGFELVKFHYPSWDMAAQFYLDVTNKALVDDSSYLVEPIVSSVGSEVDRGQVMSHALKGAALFDMMSQYVGKSNFNKAISVFCGNSQIEPDKSGVTHLHNFLNIFVKNLSQDVVDNIYSWFTLRGFPLISVHHEAGRNEYIFQQKQFTGGENDGNASWWIPVSAKSSCDGRTVSFMVSKETDRSTLPNCTFYKMNSGGHGFYRVHYSEEDARNLIGILNTRHKVFPAVDRANLLSDAFEVARLYPENIRTALDFTTYLNREHDYVPYKIGLTQLKEISRLLVGSKICAQKYIEKKVQPVMDYLNSMQKHGHSQKKLIGLLINEAALYDGDIAMTLQNMFLHWVMSKSRVHLPSHLREAVFKVGIRDGSIYSWNYMFSYYKSDLPPAEKDFVLRGLSMTKNKVLLKHLVDYSSECNVSSIYCIQEKLKLWTKVCQNENDGKKIATNAFLSNWRYLATKAGDIIEYLESFMLTCLGLGSNIMDMEEMKTLDDGNLPTHFKTSLEKVIEKISHRMKLLEKKEVVSMWFKDHGCSKG